MAALKKSARSKAAAKGWVTRKRNAEFKRRSEAAKLGHARKRIEFLRRSEAAKAGWIKRREREGKTEQPPIDTGIIYKPKARWYEVEEIEQVGKEKKYKTKK